MKTDIILSGVGGQGILSIATVIGEAAVHLGLHMKQSEVHGMSQRGGDVQSNLRISDRPIHSDLIAKGSANLILSLEPMEALRYLPFLSSDGWIVTNGSTFENIPDYPSRAEIDAALGAIPRLVVLEVDEMARELGSARVANMIMLGAASPFIGISYQELENGIRRIFARKGEAVVELNLKALAAGKAAAESKIPVTD